MADTRSLTFGVQFQASSAPLDELNQKQQEVQQAAEETTAKLDQIGTSLVGIGSRATESFRSVTGASDQMGTTVKTAMAGSIRAGDDFTKVIKTGIGAAVTNVQAKFKGFGAAGKSMAKDIGSAMAHPIATIKTTLTGALKNAITETDKLGHEAVNTGRELSDMGRHGSNAGDSLVSTLKRVAIGIGALLIIRQVTGAVKDFFNAAVNAAANAEETTSKFEVVFKDTAKTATTWVENFGSAANRSKVEVMGFMADAGALFTGMGMDTGAAADMSKMMTSLAYDLASFNNIADKDAFAKLQSGVMGEAQALKSMGIVLNDTALKQSMLSIGLRGNFNDLTESAKVQVRFNAILAQTADAQSDVIRTSDSYTNSLKGVKGLWADFLASAGAKFTPALNQMFNTIIQSWPVIEPMLMQLVDLMGNGLNMAVPILIQLGSNLLPYFAQALGVVFQVLQPLIPVFGSLVNTLLPPLLSILSILVGSLLPPFVQILDTFNRSVLQPVMPLIQALAATLLPPIAQLLGTIAPIMAYMSPILQVIGSILGVIADMLGKIIGWAASGIGKVTDFFGSLFGGSKQAAGGMDDLASSTNAVTAANEAFNQKPLISPALEIDTAGFTSKVESALDFAPIQAAESWGAAKDTATAGLAEIGSAGTDTYTSLADLAESAWSRMATAAANSVSATIAQLRQLKTTMTGLGSVTVGTSVAGGRIPHNAKGTDNFPGGPTYINEEGGEMAVLPSGSKIIPADQTDNIINNTRHQKQNIFAPNISIALGGTATEQDKTDIRAFILKVCREAYEQMQAEDVSVEALQSALL